jgi:hypothetical protein
MLEALCRRRLPCFSLLTSICKEQYQVFFKKQEEKAPTDYIKIKKKQNIITESQMAKTNTKEEKKKQKGLGTELQSNQTWQEARSASL